ncbi:hypothetical protein BC831DRAFT_451710 [Entophlyctis helioformis]|nr:hypothetical protein BC831DRAFT_451710 [Entophlyctis helioformis]
MLGLRSVAVATSAAMAPARSAVAAASAMSAQRFQSTVAKPAKKRAARKTKKTASAAATETPQPAAYVPPAFHHTLPPPLAAAAYTSTRLSIRGNLPDPRRLFWLATYKNILPSRAVFLLQNNNMDAREAAALKRSLAAQGFSLLAVRNAVFSAAIADVFSKKIVQPDGTSVAMQSLSGLRKMVVGPTLVAFSNKSETEAPRLVQGFAETIKAAGSKVALVGGKLDGSLLTAESFERVLGMPGLQRLRGEIVGLLEMPAASIVGTLERTPGTLVATIGQHAKQLTEAASGEAAAPADKA